MVIKCPDIKQLRGDTHRSLHSLCEKTNSLERDPALGMLEGAPAPGINTQRLAQLIPKETSLYVKLATELGKIVYMVRVFQS